MNKITLAQREALDIVKGMIDRSNTNVPEFGTKVMTLILGILNVDCIVEHTTTDIVGDKNNPIPNPNNGNDKIHINMPDWLKELPTPPFVPKDISHPDPCPFPPQVWYDQEPEPIQTDARDDVRYVTEVSCTGDKNGIVYVSNTTDVQYNGDFIDIQTSFNDK